ncbi:MAG: ABC transporter substrate-binding protein [Scytolyngbya sp. HA4215-MV1]|jgi:NitT/TauT family transport system substrate-binding protein|nr:ABC transporter substrate-binding protein [Scytolyngbya sp. HA4215-MV1]
MKFNIIPYFYLGSRQRTQCNLKPPRFAGLLIITFLLCFVLNACGIGQPQPLQPLKIGITTWPGFDIVLYAQQTGQFKKRGLQVEITRFENQQDSARAVLRGSLDAAFTSLWDVVQVDPGNDKPVVVLVTNISHGSDGIVTQSKIKSVQDLRGKKVGAKLGTVNHLILLEALKLHHIKPADVEIEDISNESSAQLIEEKKLDGAVLWQPLLGGTAQKIKGNIVFTTKEIDSLVIDTLVSSSEAVHSKREEMIQFVSTWLDVMYAVETKPTEVFAVVGKVLGQSGQSFGSDYAGLKKGDIALQQRMFQSESRLKQAIQQMSQLLQEDPRSGRIPREDVEINGDLITAAIKQWKP